MTTRCRIIICIPLLILFLLPWHSYGASLTLNAPNRVYFSPNGGGTQAIINEIASAKVQILVQAYSFTSAPIAKTLVDAHKRGVKVEALLDKSQRRQNIPQPHFSPT